MRKSKLSYIYLIWGTLAVIGFIAFFERWPQPLLSLFILAIPFYLATLTFTILIHPVLCIAYFVKKVRAKNDAKPILMHLVWSLTISIIFIGMVINGYIITVWKHITSLLTTQVFFKSGALAFFWKSVNSIVMHKKRKGKCI